MFHNVVFKSKPGASPELFLLDGEGETVEVIDLAPYNQKGCNDLLKRKGFFKKDNMATVIPPEYETGPYIEVSQDQIVSEPSDHGEL